jgi:hypothetical protein
VAKKHYTDSQNLNYHSSDLQEAKWMQQFISYEIGEKNFTAQHFEGNNNASIIQHSQIHNTSIFFLVIQPSASKMCLETNQFVYTKWHIFYSGAQHYDYVGNEFFPMNL